MHLEGTVPITAVETNVATNDLAAAVRQFKAQYPGARVETIDGMFVRGVCDCGTPVMKNDHGYRYDNENDKYICAACVTRGGQQQET